MSEQRPVLTGRLLSPFVRRVAVSLAHLDVAFERRILSAVDDISEIEHSNPVGRVPTMILADGEILVDSAAILDHFDQQAGTARALIPPSGSERRRALYLLAVSCGAIERAMVANAERKRPPERQLPERLQRLLRQTRQGFEALDTELGSRDWFDGRQILQPDITCAVGVTFVRHIFPALLPSDSIPRLSDLTARCEELPAFVGLPID